MKSHNIKRRRLFQMIGGTVAFGGWAMKDSAGAQADSVSLGFPANLTGAIAIIGEEAKIFEKTGARVSFHKFNSGAAVRDAMIAQRVELGIMNATPFVIGVAKGELSGLAVAEYAGRIIMVVGRKDAGFKTVADLRGKKVGSQLGSGTDHVFQNSVLPKYGLKPSDVQIINVKFTDQVSALASRSIDAYAGTEPYSSIAEHSGIGTVLVDYSQFDLSPIMLAVNRPVLQRKPDAVVAFLKGWLEVVRLIKEHPAQASQAIWKFYKAQGYDVPEPVFRSALSRIDFTPDYAPELKGYLTDQAKTLVENKQITHIPDWDKELLRQPLAQAREQLKRV